MKLRTALALALWLVPMIAQAEQADQQSIYTISQTMPMSLTSGSTRIGPLPNQTRAVRFGAKTDAHCRFGDSTVVATLNDAIIFAYTPEVLKVQPTDGNYIACTRDSADGQIFIDYMKP